MTLRVLDPGLSSLVVDNGRPNYRSLGVPVGGAADRTALALGNALVGNPPDAPALEITLAGPTLRAEHELACVVYGAPFQLASDRQQPAMGKTFTLHPQELLHIRGTDDGARAYLCVSGGFQEPEVLGSRSALQPLRHGDLLNCVKSAIHTRWARIDFAWRRARAVHAGSDGLSHRTLLIVDGPQASWFPRDAITPKEGAPYPFFTVSPASNRMGLRLQGAALPVPDRELVSEPVCPGTIQVTRDGQCILLGVDSQTIGGYPKIGQVISADLDELAQLRPADQVRFVRVGLAEAEALYRQKQAEVRHWILRMRTALGGL